MGASESRGARWVMLRDETPRGFIEQRREKKERTEGEEGKGRKRKETKPVVGRRRKENTAARRRGARRLAPL